MVKLAIGLLGSAASGLGVNLALVAFLGGLALGAGPAGFVGKLWGHHQGYAEGFAASDLSAKLNDETRKRQEVERDLTVARANADALSRDRSEDQNAMQRAAAAAQGYRDALEEKKQLGTVGLGGDCLLTDDDRDRLLANEFSRGKSAPKRGEPARR